MSCTLMAACPLALSYPAAHTPSSFCRSWIDTNNEGCPRPPLSVCTIFGLPSPLAFECRLAPLCAFLGGPRLLLYCPTFTPPNPPSVVSPLLAGCQLLSLCSPAWLSAAAVPASKCANQTEACRATLASAPCPSLPGLMDRLDHLPCMPASILRTGCPMSTKPLSSQPHCRSLAGLSSALSLTPRPYAACIYSPPKLFSRPSVDSSPPACTLATPVKHPSAVPPCQSVSLWHCGRFSRSTASSSHPMPLPSRLRQLSPTHARRPSANALAPCT